MKTSRRILAGAVAMLLAGGAGQALAQGRSQSPMGAPGGMQNTERFQDRNQEREPVRQRDPQNGVGAETRTMKQERNTTRQENRDTMRKRHGGSQMGR